MSRENSHDAMFWFFLAIFVVSIYLIGVLFWPFASPIILGAVITGVCNPIYNSLLSRKINPSLASLATCLIIFVVLFVPIVLCVGILSKEAYDLYLAAKTAVLDDKVIQLLESNLVLERANLVLSKLNIELTGEELNKAISQTAKVIGFYLYEQARTIASNMFVFLVNFFFMLLVVFFLLLDGDKLIAFIIDLSPLPKEQDERLIQKFKDMAGAILIGNGFCGLFQGIIGGVVFAIFGLKSPFLWGLIMSLLAFLPIAGIGVVFIPAAFYLILSGRVASGIFFIIFYILLSGGIEYIFKPRLVGKRVRMHILLVFLSIIGGLKLFGILGIIYGPLVVTAFLTLTDIYHSSYRKMIEPDNDR